MIRTRTFLSFTLGTVFALAASAAFAGEFSIVTVPARDRAALQSLADYGLDCSGGVKNGRQALVVPKRDVAKLTGRFGASVVHADADVLFEPFKRRQTVGAYHTYDKVKAELQALAAAKPDIAEVFSVGKSIEGRDLWAIRIGKRDGVARPKFFIMGAHHAREWISVEMPMNTAHLLVESYGTDADLTKLVDSRTLVILPMVNPDGVTYSQTNYTMWRKNRRKNADNTYGVDLNRNYGFEWDGVGSSASTSSDTYRGTAPFSEPETQAISKFLLAEKFNLVLSFHSYSELVLYPWGYKHEHTGDAALEQIGKAMAKFNGYHPQMSSDLYLVNGELCDYSVGALKTPGFTIELGTEFIPPEAEIPAIWKANRGAVLYCLERVGAIYPLIDHTPLRATTDTANPYPVTAKLDAAHHSGLDGLALTLAFQTAAGGAWSEVPMTTANGNASAAIPAQPFGTTVHYRIVARRGAQVVEQCPTNGGANTFRVVPTLVLVVDNDEGKPGEQGIAEALAAEKIDFDLVSIDDLNAADLPGYNVIVWHAGKRSSETFPDAFQAPLAAYVRSGGRLLAAGQDIAYNLRGSAFLRDLLGAKYVADSATAKSAAGSDGWPSIGIATGDEPGAQDFQDVLDPVSGAKTVLTYEADTSGSKSAGLAGVVDKGRVVYFGFGLEGVKVQPDRRKLIAKALAWLRPSRREMLDRLATLPAGAASERLIRNLELAWGVEARAGDRSALAALDAVKDPTPALTSLREGLEKAYRQGELERRAR